MTTNTVMTTQRRGARAAAAALAVLLVLALNAPDRRVHAQHAAGDVVTQPPRASEAVPGAVIGFVVDLDGDPIAGAMVSLADTRPPGVPVATASFMPTSDVATSTGRFMLGRIADGEYVLQVSAQGYRSQQVEGVRVEPGMASNLRVTLSRTGEPTIPAEHLAAAEVRRAPPGAPPPPPPPPPVPSADAGMLVGIVTDTAGVPVAGAVVSVPGASGGRRSAVTNDEGRFRLGGLSPGRRVLTVTAPRFAGVEVADVEFVAGETTAVTVMLHPFR